MTIRAFFGTEAPFPIDEEIYKTLDTLRVTIPNSLIEPRRAANLWHEYLDQWQYADEVGMNVTVNEHHSTATCMNSTSTLVAGILARITTKAQILMLGNPISNRMDPVRVAEETAMIDVISRGRLLAGMVRGVPFEISATNSPPIGQRERYWEALDLIVKAWTTHDGPFNWQGKYFEHRQVNIVPRPYQAPHPPIVVPTVSVSSVADIARRNYTCATVLQSAVNTRRLFDEYRRVRQSLGDFAPAADRLNCAQLCFVGDTEAEAMAGARKVAGFLTHNKTTVPFWAAPGFVPPEMRGKVLKGGRPFSVEGGDGDVEKLIEQGVVFAGTPDQVFAQMERFNRAVGGYDQQNLMMQGWDTPHAMVMKSVRLFATEVYPRLKELNPASYHPEPGEQPQAPVRPEAVRGHHFSPAVS